MKKIRIIWNRIPFPLVLPQNVPDIVPPADGDQEEAQLTQGSMTERWKQV